MGLVDFSRFPRRSVLCIDVKSFFASVEAGSACRVAFCVAQRQWPTERLALRRRYCDQARIAA